jgi:hypothetical protein
MTLRLAPDETVVREEDARYVDGPLSTVEGTVTLTDRRIAFQTRGSFFTSKRLLVEISRQAIKLTRAGTYGEASNVLVVQTADGRSHSVVLRSNVIDWMKATKQGG